MAQAVFRNKRGVSLVEMMVAMTVLLFVSLAMMQVALVGINSNRQNSLRDEGTRLASVYMNEMRTRSIANRTALVGATETATVPINFRSNTVNFEVTQTIINNAGTRWDKAQVRVDWDWRGEIFNTVLSTLVETDNN